jgi:hypothetical protein
MRKSITKFGLISSVLSMVLISGSVVFALPHQTSAHAQVAGSGTSNSQAANSAGSTYNQGRGKSANAETRLAAAQLRACQNRQTAINNIMIRIDTRAQNQLNLFGTIATRVENFYVKRGKTLSNYYQLVAAINAAKVQAENDFGTLKNSSTFNCSGTNPKGMILQFRTYLKTEISDLQTYRTAVKNLIVGVASVNGVTVSGSNQSSSQGGR